MVTKIVIPSLGEPGVCENWLREHGYEYEARPVDGGVGYAQMLADLWAEGEGFLMIEADITPSSPEDLERLLSCPEPWCSHPYLAPVLHLCLGILKVTDEGLERTQDLPEHWAGHHWSVVDSKLIPAMLGKLPLHGHMPPFGHGRFNDGKPPA